MMFILNVLCTPNGNQFFLHSCLVAVFGASLFFFLSALTVHADVSPEQAARLTRDLTPLGATRSANSDGSIPEWELDTMPAETHSKLLNDLEKETPLFTVTHANMDQHLELLSPGLQRLLTTYPDTFYIPVYQTHRTARLPDWLYENAIKNASEAKISESGGNVTYALPGIPFPIPNSGEEAIWNHELRWKGLFFKLNTIEAIINKNGSYNLIRNMLEVYSVYHNVNRPINFDNWRYTYYLSYIQAPARIAGGAYLSYESMKPQTNPRQSWMYVAGQRRMRRSPVMGYDAPTFTSDGLRMMDEIDVFNGALDRYQWSLKGVKEMYIPYNNSVLHKAMSNDEKVLTSLHTNPEYTRYEKHRVWVVDATLKPGKEHLYKRRTFYLDEDSWGTMLVDIYDEDDDLWRVTQRYATYFESVPVTFTAMDTYSDLKKQSYYIQAFPEGFVHSYEPPRKGYFSPNIVRQRLHR